MELSDTIVALSTPRQIGALAVVRMSGNRSLTILQQMVKKNISALEGGKCFFANIYKDKNDPETLIDQGVICVFRSPKSYTGEDIVEFSIHGSPAVADDLIQACISNGARLARPGEFSYKACLNGKMSLLQAEGVDDFIKACSSAGRKLALGSLAGKSTEDAEKLASELIDAVAEAEYVLEDDLTEGDSLVATVKNGAGKKVAAIRDEVSELLRKTRLGKRVYDGIDVAIVGKPNVGKSSLLNALLEENKAIVTPIPGTTRDIVEGRTEIDGIQFRFLDTAGIRATSDPVESIGVEKSLEALKKADIVLFLSDEDGFKADPEVAELLKDKKTVKVGSKKDIKSVSGADVWVSAITNDLGDLKKALIESAGLSSARSQAAFMSDRDIGVLTELEQDLSKATEALYDKGYVDAFSDMVRRGVQTVNALLGKSAGQAAEDIYQTIFSRFCMGK